VADVPHCSRMTGNRRINISPVWMLFCIAPADIALGSWGIFGRLWTSLYWLGYGDLDQVEESKREPNPNGLEAQIHPRHQNSIASDLNSDQPPCHCCFRVKLESFLRVKRSRMDG
jgi:hypothetical protein